MTRIKSPFILAVTASAYLIACSNSGSTEVEENNRSNPFPEELEDRESEEENVILSSPTQPIVGEGLVGPLGGPGINGEYAQFNDSPFASISFGNGYFYFEAFDVSGQSLGSIVASHANASFNGETVDDRFYGVVNYSGVSSIRINNEDRRTGIEVDHLQWGFMPEELR